jgi:hypothetical protein
VDDVLKLLTFLVACGLAFIAYQQFQIARAKLKIDLFEKRIAVFNATRQMLGAMVSDGPGELEKVYEFRAAVAAAPFLFDDDVIAYLEEIDSRAVDLRAIVKRIEKPSTNGDRDSLIDKEAAVQIWFKNQLLEITAKFMPYLGLHTWR